MFGDTLIFVVDLGLVQFLDLAVALLYPLWDLGTEVREDHLAVQFVLASLGADVAQVRSEHLLELLQRGALLEPLLLVCSFEFLVLYLLKYAVTPLRIPGQNLLELLLHLLIQVALFQVQLALLERASLGDELCNAIELPIALLPDLVELH